MVVYILLTCPRRTFGYFRVPYLFHESRFVVQKLGVEESYYKLWILHYYQRLNTSGRHQALSALKVHIKVLAAILCHSYFSETCHMLMYRGKFRNKEQSCLRPVLSRLCRLQ